MIHGLPIPITHIASVYHDRMPFPKVVQGDNLVKSHGPHKKGNL